MAEAFARIHGGEKVEAYSAGSRPSGIVNPKAIEAMRELGCDLSGQRSKSIVDLPDVEFDFVATMGCGDACPYIPGKRYVDWDLPDPNGRPIAEVRATREEIARRVDNLIDELDATERAGPSSDPTPPPPHVDNSSSGRVAGSETD